MILLRKFYINKLKIKLKKYITIITTKQKGARKLYNNNKLLRV